MSDENDENYTEKRKFTRKKVHKKVQIDVDGESATGETIDISLSGVAIHSLVDMTTEQFVSLHLQKIGDLTGEIVREFEDGFAVKFDTVEDNGSVLEDKLRKMMGTDKKETPVDEMDDAIAIERARMEAQLMAMMGGGGNDDD